MEQQFDFESVGKRLPYSVPEGFFEDNMEAVLARVGHIRRLRRRVSLLAPVGAIAAAAAIAVGMFLHAPAPARPAQEAAAQQCTPVDKFVSSLSDQELQELDNAMSTDYFLSDNSY